MDDVVSGADRIEDVHQLYQASKAILREGGFNFRKFKSNDPSLQKVVNEAEGVAAPLGGLNESETYAQSTLGSSQQTCPGEQRYWDYFGRWILMS